MRIIQIAETITTLKREIFENYLRTKREVIGIEAIHTLAICA